MKDIFQATLDESGRVQIPSKVISELHLAPGSTLVIREQEGTITLQPIEEEPSVIEKDGILVIHAKFTGDLSNIVEKEREKRIADIIGESFK